MSNDKRTQDALNDPLVKAILEAFTDLEVDYVEVNIKEFEYECGEAKHD